MFSVYFVSCWVCRLPVRRHQTRRCPWASAVWSTGTVWWELQTVRKRDGPMSLTASPHWILANPAETSAVTSLTGSPWSALRKKQGNFNKLPWSPTSPLSLVYTENLRGFDEEKLICSAEFYRKMITPIYRFVKTPH